MKATLTRGYGRTNHKGSDTMTTECSIELTPGMLHDISQCEAVVVREYETDDGRRYAQAVAWGDADEMRDAADTPGIFVVPVGVKIVSQRSIPVSELLPDNKPVTRSRLSQRLADSSSACIDMLMEYRRLIYAANGYQSGPLVNRLDDVVSELRRLRVDLSIVDTGKAIQKSGI